MRSLASKHVFRKLYTLPWDKEKAYSRDAVELYYEVSSGAFYFSFYFYSSCCSLPSVSDILPKEGMVI